MQFAHRVCVNCVPKIIPFSQAESIVHRLHPITKLHLSFKTNTTARRNPITVTAAAKLTNTPTASASVQQRTTMKLVLVVAVAMLKEDGQVLLAQRPEGKAMAGLWEFPGGKVEPNETPEEALCRELHEELGVVTQPTSLIPLCFASHTYEEQAFHLLMPLYVCKRYEGTPDGRENQALAWVTVDELRKYDMPAADIPLLPAIESVMRDAAARYADSAAKQ